MRIVYPTTQQVMDSVEGINAGNSLPFPLANYRRQIHYMQPLLCTWNASKTGRDRHMPHIKAYPTLRSDGW
jgi:hypothetical protein